MIKKKSYAIGYKSYSFNQVTYEKPTDIIMIREKLEQLTQKFILDKDAQSHHYYTIILNIIARASRQEKGIKKIQIGKEKVKLSLLNRLVSFDSY